jgi:hypothetical protein
VQIVWPFLSPSRLLSTASLWGGGRRGVLRAGVAYIPLFRQITWADMPPRTAMSWISSRLFRHAAGIAAAAAPTAQHRKPSAAVHGSASAAQPESIVRNAVLYIGRAPGRNRAIDNEGELLDAMAASLKPGLRLEVLIDPGYWRDAAAVAARALVLVSPHGGALLVRVCRGLAGMVSRSCWHGVVVLPPGVLLAWCRVSRTVC